MNTTVIKKKVGVINMKLAHCKIFAQLCEEITEASTAMNLIAGSPGGQQVVQTLHRDLGLAHNIEYQPVDKLSWKNLKDTHRGAWVIITGTQGTAAIRARADSYETMASDGSDVDHNASSRSDVTMNFIKSKVGKIQRYYVGKNTFYVKDKQSTRADNKGDGKSRCCRVVQSDTHMAVSSLLLPTMSMLRLLPEKSITPATGVLVIDPDSTPSP